MASKEDRMNTHLKLAFNASALQDHLSASIGLKPRKIKKGNKKGTQSRYNSKQADLEKFRGKQVEYVLTSKTKSELSLAEKYGLIKADEDVLSEKLWEIVKRKSALRNDSNEPCSICMEMYQPSKMQVILSCSHVFHRNCISSFQKYSGKRECPICRKSNYEERVIFEGAKITMQKAALKIQTFWRCHKERKIYSNFRKDNPPINPLLRNKYFQEKFFTLSNKMHDRYLLHEKQIDDLCLDIDQNLILQRSLIQALDDGEMLQKEWDNIQNKAIERTTEECPICLSKLTLKGKEIALLSCSHLFHKSCIESYEKFQISTISHEATCPICRTNYSKKNIKI